MDKIEIELWLRRAKGITDLMENRFGWGPIKFGLDSIVGLIPIAGDSLTLLVSFYLIVIAIKLKLPIYKILFMILMVLIDWVVGLIPILGDLLDFVFKANNINYKILQKHF